MSGLLEQEKFQAWKTNFITQCLGYIYEDGQDIRRPISEAFSRLDEIQLAIGSTDMLRDNILLACYRAHYYPEDREKREEESRQRWETGFESLPEQERITNQTIRFISEHNSFSLNSMRYGSQQRDPLPEDESLNDLRTLEELLIKFSIGLKRLKNPEHPANLDRWAASEYGPFILPRLNKETSKRPIRDIRRIGLIFNLAYIFRYFTGYDPLKHKVISNLVNDELIICGQMIFGIGEPHFGLVAAFVNATLDGKLNRRDVQEKLRDFLAFPEFNMTVLTKFPQKRKGNHREVEWAGWPAPLN